MPTCFVIQPFDSGKYDKRFHDIYKPALEQAGLVPYRVDQDPTVEVHIDAIENGIRDATICLADITTDNPNVWYELGFAFASGRSVIMVCSDERPDGRFPFDIQHRTVIKYSADSPSDFEKLRNDITKRAKALVRKDETRQFIESEQLAPREGLSQVEIQVLAIAAGNNAIPGDWISVHSLKSDAERSGLTDVGFGVGIRRLEKKGLIELEWSEDNYGNSFQTAALSDNGWDWISSNDSLFDLIKRESNSENFDDEHPF